MIADEVAGLHPLRPRFDVTEDSTFREAGLDALDVSGIAVRIEDEFGVDLTDAQITAWASVADVIATVERLRIEA